MFYIDNETKTQDKYDMAKFLDFDNSGTFDCLNSYMLYALPKLPAVGEYKITPADVNRPDMLSYNLYGGTQYWWIIMQYNSLSHPSDLKLGLKIKFPSLGTIEQLYLNISLQQKTQDK